MLEGFCEVNMKTPAHQSGWNTDAGDTGIVKKLVKF
jgi:hypothetical protein